MPCTSEAIAVFLGKRILFVGYGAVAQCTLPILMKHMKVSPKNVTVMDFEDRRKVLAPWLKKGVKYLESDLIDPSLAAEFLRAQLVIVADALFSIVFNWLKI